MTHTVRHIRSLRRAAIALLCCALSLALSLAPLGVTSLYAYAENSAVSAQGTSGKSSQAQHAEPQAQEETQEEAQEDSPSEEDSSAAQDSGESQPAESQDAPAEDAASGDSGEAQEQESGQQADQSLASQEDFLSESAEESQASEVSSAAAPVASADAASADAAAVSQEAAPVDEAVMQAQAVTAQNAQDAKDDAKADEEAKPVSAELMYRNPATGKYELFDATTSRNDPEKVLAVRNTAYFDVQVTYSDGAVKRASSAGLAVTWRLSNNTHGGEEVVSISKDGKMTISGVSSKLVQLKAKVAGLDVNRCPAYINIVGETEKPSAGKAIDSITISYSDPSSGSSGGSSSSADLVVDEAAADPVPVITSRGGSLVFNASVTFIDAAGNRTTSTGSLSDLMLAWQTVALYNQLGDRTDTLIANAKTLGSSGVITATESGDGWVIIRCASNAYPGFSGREMLVRIAGNIVQDPATEQANTVAGARLVYKPDGSGTYKVYEGTAANTPTIIDTPNGNVAFDALLTFADGSTALASDRGVAVDYAMAGNMTSAGVPLAQMAPDGTLSATHFKNGTVRIASAQVNGMNVAGTSAYVRIFNNDASVQPATDSLDISATSNYWLQASQRPDDASANWYWRAVPTKGNAAYSVPLVVSSPGSNSSCDLEAAVRWSNSQVTTSQDDDGGKREWSLGPSVDSKGNACLPLVYVTRDGKVYPTGSGSGYATVHCSVKLPLYDQSGVKVEKELTGTYRIAVYTSKNYVKAMTLLDESGKPIKTSSITLKSGKNTYKFSVKITYIGYDEKTGKVGEYDVVVPADRAHVEGLEWKVYRTEELKDDELYSQIREDGNFRAKAGFARGYVYANLKGASFTGKDIGAGVTVIAEDSIESLGHTDSVEVRMYHYSDYMKRGDEAKPAKQVTLSRAQLSAMADYTTWYTFQRRDEAYSTVYAHGVTMRNLLALCGVDPDRLISMAFTGSDGYFAERHSADFILGSQYRYTNYYYHSTMPGLLGQQSVSPMLALSYYMKNNAGYEDATDKSNAGDAGFGYMTQDSTFRMISGMTGVNVRNANQSISNVSLITIIVEDNTFPPEKKEEKEEKEEIPDVPDPTTPPTPNDEQHGTPGLQGVENGGESANPFMGRSNEGVGTDTKHGSAVAVSSKSGETAEAGEETGTNERADDKGSQSGQSTQDSDQAKGETDQSGNPLVRELRENARPVLPPAEIDSVWWVGVTTTGLLAFFVGGLFSGRRYALDRADGIGIGLRSRRKNA